MKDLIQSLKSSLLVAKCRCGGEFPLSKALLFDGTKPFPEEAESRRLTYEEDLKTRTFLLKKGITAASQRAEVTAEAVTIGQTVEHLVPALEGFHFNPADCRTLFDPIDLLVFEGLTSSQVNSLTFLEIKTGSARLNRHQALVRDAVEEERVSYKEV